MRGSTTLRLLTYIPCTYIPCSISWLSSTDD
jgi:hypothetical protein